MFTFTTTTIINSDKDPQSGKPMYAKVDKSAKHGLTLRIKRDFTFEMPGITKIYKRVFTPAEMAELTIDCSKIIEQLPQDIVYPAPGRIAIYIALEGSEESVFANDFYQKGLPFSIGFLIKDAKMTGETLAKEIKKAADRISTVGRKLFEITESTGTLTFKCTDEYMRFKTVAVLLDLGTAEKELVHIFDCEAEGENEQDILTITKRGKAGFGTFRHLLKDLRLPTAVNTGWTALYREDRPVPGATYNQYVIYYEAPSLTNPSLAAVGHATRTKTIHSFWVLSSLATAFEAVVAEVTGEAAAKNDPTKIFEEVDDSEE